MARSHEQNELKRLFITSLQFYASVRMFDWRQTNSKDVRLTKFGHAYNNIASAGDGLLHFCMND